MSSQHESLVELLDSAAFARAYALTTFTVVLAGGFIEALAGATTVTTIMVGLVAIGAAVLFVRRRELSLLRVVPSSIIMLLVWMALSLAWSTDVNYTWAAVLGAIGYAFVAVVIANTRDTLQTVRALGDVLRVLLAASLLIELFSGVWFDMPFESVGVQGNITAGGPVQGIFGTRNVLGLVGVIAIITFVIEIRTHSITKGLGFASVVLAGGLVGLSLSPTAIMLVGVVAAASAALSLVRRTPRERHNAVQLTLASLVVIAITGGLIFRHQIIRWLGAGTDIATRADLWNAILDYSHLRLWQGWGYYGPWAPNEFPFWSINQRSGGDMHLSALNAFFDMTIQLGVVGLMLFVFAGGLALARAWVIATERKSTLYAFTPLLLITLLANSMFESTVISGFGLTLLVLGASRAGQVKSWRELLDAGRPQRPSIDPG